MHTLKMLRRGVGWGGVVNFFHNQQESKIFSHLEDSFFFNLGFPGFYFWFGTPSPPHISTGASCSVSLCRVTHSGCGQTNCTRVGLFKGHAILSITMIKNETIHIYQLPYPALASARFCESRISSIFLHGSIDNCASSIYMYAIRFLCKFDLYVCDSIDICVSSIYMYAVRFIFVRFDWYLYGSIDICVSSIYMYAARFIFVWFDWYLYDSIDICGKFDLYVCGSIYFLYGSIDICTVRLIFV